MTEAATNKLPGPLKLVVIGASQGTGKAVVEEALGRGHYVTAVARNPRFAVSTVELDRPGPSYSVDTIREFAGQLTKRDSLYFIIGLDAFIEIGTWKDFKEI